jgi:hypothetical protein
MCVIPVVSAQYATIKQSIITQHLIVLHQSTYTFRLYETAETCSYLDLL